MPVEVRHSPPPMHHPGETTTRPRGILKNPSFSNPSYSAERQSHSPTKEETSTLPSSTPHDAEQEKDITLQNTLQNAGHRRSSSSARRASASASRRHSSAPSSNHDDDPDKMRLKWDEANLYLAEQESGGRMKITEPKTPFQYGDAMEDEEDVAIDPRYVNVDEVDMANNKSPKKSRESDIPGLELGEPEEDMAVEPGMEDERIIRRQSLSRESSKEKHVSVSSGSGEGMEDQVGLPTKEEQEKHRQFEERRKAHYEMRSVKGLLGHPEEMNEDEENQGPAAMPTTLPERGVNGVR